MTRTLQPLFGDSDQFVHLVENYFGFLEKYGFRRSPQADHIGGALWSIVYEGNSVRIDIYYDVRDKFSGVSFIRKRDGRFLDLLRLVPNTPISESLTLTTHLSPGESELARWAEYLKRYGRLILADSEEAFERLPSQPKPIGLIENAQPHHALDCPTFHQLVEHYFAFLHLHGFERRPDLEHLDDPSCTCVFAGKHIGIMIYLSQPTQDWWHALGSPRTADIYVGVNVVRLRDYRQRDLGRYFVGMEGFESELPVPESASPVEREVARWAELLKRYGQRLLADREDSWEVS